MCTVLQITSLVNICGCALCSDKCRKLSEKEVGKKAQTWDGRREGEEKDKTSKKRLYFLRNLENLVIIILYRQCLDEYGVVIFSNKNYLKYFFVPIMKMSFFLS